MHKNRKIENKNESNMKRTILIALVLSASIGSQVTLRAATVAATQKLGSLSFALTDTYQGPASVPSRGVRAVTGNLAVTDTVSALTNCAGNFKYLSDTTALNNASILRAISSAITGNAYPQAGGSGNGIFTSKAKIVIWNYDNTIPAPPYPPYLPQLEATPAPAAATINGPLIQDPGASPVTDTIVSAAGVFSGTQLWAWPNLDQIDWVDYDGTASQDRATLDPALWPKALVYVEDSGANSPYPCLNVSPFFSFEEAYCYFCWDTVDRVTDGTLSTGNSTSGDICIGSSTIGSSTQCKTKGSGTTRFYLTIKFNNVNSDNSWLDNTVAGVSVRPWLPANPYNAITANTVPAVAVLHFTLSGVVSYAWTITSKNGISAAFGTMTMSTADGFAGNPWCGVLKGSVTVTETTDAAVNPNYIGCIVPFVNPNL
jgi:hypothetical protein